VFDGLIQVRLRLLDDGAAECFLHGGRGVVGWLSDWDWDWDGIGRAFERLGGIVGRPRGMKESRRMRGMGCGSMHAGGSLRWMMIRRDVRV
jgi:hypothetical protein